MTRLAGGATVPGPQPLNDSRSTRYRPAAAPAAATAPVDFSFHDPRPSARSPANRSSGTRDFQRRLEVLSGRWGGGRGARCRRAQVDGQRRDLHARAPPLTPRVLSAPPDARRELRATRIMIPSRRDNHGPGISASSTFRLDGSANVKEMVLRPRSDVCDPAHLAGHGRVKWYNGYIFAPRSARSHTSSCGRVGGCRRTSPQQFGRSTISTPRCSRILLGRSSRRAVISTSSPAQRSAGLASALRPSSCGRRCRVGEEHCADAVRDRSLPSPARAMQHWCG